MRSTRVPFLVPADLDPPTGGNRYDQHLLAGIPALQAVSGPLGHELAAAPDGATVLLDGLFATPHPDVLAAHADRVRLVLLLHLLRADDDPPGADLADELRSLDLVDTVVVTSRSSARRVAELGVTTPVVVAPPGTGPAPTSPAAGAHRLLCVGTVGPRKGQELLAEAVDRLGPPFTLRCAGTVDSPFDRPGTALLGPLGPAALQAEWDRADLHVLLSAAEPYGMAVAEGLARGVPSLVTRAGELPDLVGQAGLVVERDVDAVVATLRRWAADAALRRELRRAARERTLPTWQDTVDLVAGVVAGAVAGVVAGEVAPG